jgi:hypothetical protein
MIAITCHACKSVYQSESKIGRERLCPSCGIALHACLNCRFHDKLAHHQCRENQAENVQDKKFGNFCEYFDPKPQAASSPKSSLDEARKKWDDLFKKS